MTLFPQTYVCFMQVSLRCMFWSRPACFAQQPFGVFTLPVLKVPPNYFGNRFAADTAYETRGFEPYESALGHWNISLSVLLKENHISTLFWSFKRGKNTIWLSAATLSKCQCCYSIYIDYIANADEHLKHSSYFTNSWIVSTFSLV